MIMHAVRTHEYGCLIIREKPRLCVRPKRFVAKHDHWYKLIEQRATSQAASNELIPHKVVQRTAISPPMLQCISKLQRGHDHVYSDLKMYRFEVCTRVKVIAQRLMYQVVWYSINTQVSYSPDTSMYTLTLNCPM